MNPRWQDVPIPAKMAHLAKDRRGFPIPFIVARDNAGEPLFTINDERLTLQAIAETLCGICGSELEVGHMWFVGGPLSAFHPHGCYIDGPMHHECAQYALTVCPHLAAPRYTKRVDGFPSLKNGVPFKMAMDQTVMPDRPSVFVAGRALSYSVSWPLAADRKLYPVAGKLHDNPGDRPARWLDYEVWEHGVQLDEETGIAKVRAALEAHKSQTVQKPRLLVPDNALIV